MNRLVLALILGLLAACSTTPYKTNHDYDREARFETYRSYSWVSENPMVRSDGSRANSPLWQQRIMRAVEAELTRKGFRLAPKGQRGDFAVAFTVGSRDKVRVDSYPSHYRHGWWGPGYYGEQVSVRNYTEGTLAIDIFDAASGKPVWHGWATGNIREKRELDERIQIVRDAVASILDRFPPA